MMATLTTASRGTAIGYGRFAVTAIAGKGECHD